MRSLQLTAQDVLRDLRTRELTPANLADYLEELKASGVTYAVLMEAGQRYIWEATRIEITSATDSESVH